ncbi:hypothetical protein BN1708_011098 [Verticillium longisporum]|uniref:UNC-45/Cro1/She4 central domain-containing protein n=1 Tax=Verticillium longisporum TaxID=100787 RepID=A0A0G4KXR5_VERLO|nr:hypothetical protein BN1708_011098 [Verticillium longisporum]
MAAVSQALPPKVEQSREDETLLLLARLMEGGREDDETVQDLDQLTKLLNDDTQLAVVEKNATSICSLLDAECVDTVFSYLDMRQADVVRGHAVMTVAAYLKAAGDEGGAKLSTFFFDKVRRGTYDDYIAAFCVAAAAFPIAPDLTASLFLSEGFLGTLGPLMRRKWKSRKVETACLEMLNAACMNSQCRDAVQKYCTEWLEEVVDQDPNEVVKEMQQNPEYLSQEGSVTMRRHSEGVQNLAAVILAKLRAVPSAPSLNDQGKEERITPAITTIEELSTRFTGMLLSDDNYGTQHSIEGLAYASLQPKVKEDLVRNKDFLKKLISTLAEAQPRSPLTYGALSILVNLTRYQPNLSEEQKKMHQLKAYANAAGKIETEPLNDDTHVAARCKLVFDAGVVPVLVSRSKLGSPASLALMIAIINSISVTAPLRGQIAQQGAVKLLLTAWLALPETEMATRRVAAHALARILISTDPSLVFGGNRSHPQSSAVRPLLSILAPDAAAETRDLLPTFESLLALTNLASNDGDCRRAIVRSAWSDIEELLLSSKTLISRAAVELVCNLVQGPEGATHYVDGSPQAKQRMHILLALADAEDEKTRVAAGGALAQLTGHENVVRAIVERERGVEVVLGMVADESENVRYCACHVVYHMAATDGRVGVLAREKINAANGLEILKEAAKKSRRADVVEIAVEALKVLLEDGRS